MNVRRPEPGDFQVLQGEIDKVRQEATALERSHAETTAAHKAELAKDAQWFNESEVREHRHNLNHIEQRQALVSDRIAALEDRLPTPEQRRKAKREAQSLVKAAEDASRAFTKWWSTHMVALETADSLSRDLTTARADARAAVYPLADLVAKFGLDVTVPKMPEPPKDDATFAGLLATRLRYISYTGESDTTTERDLAAERRRREKVEG
jgi:DNA repair exonuclease SbcCD ATPase subunit